MKIFYRPIVRKHKPNFSPACAAFGQTARYWTNVYRGLVSKRRVRREFAKAKARAAMIRKSLREEGFFDSL